MTLEEYFVELVEEIKQSKLIVLRDLNLYSELVKILRGGRMKHFSGFKRGGMK